MCNELQHKSENIRLRHENAQLKEQNKELYKDNTSLYALLYEIRKAAGDPEGKLMQDDLIRHIANHRQSVERSAVPWADNYNKWRATFQSGELAAQTAFSMMMQALEKAEHYEKMIDQGVA